MQTDQAIIESHQKLVISNATSQTGGISGFLARMFGCRHKEMSRPFSIQDQTYRTCLDCGARRQFNLKRWEMQGDYYYGQPGTKVFRPLRGLGAQRVTALSPMRG
jgi:hypothetical protein